MSYTEQYKRAGAGVVETTNKYMSELVLAMFYTISSGIDAKDTTIFLGDYPGLIGGNSIDLLELSQNLLLNPSMIKRKYYEQVNELIQAVIDNKNLFKITSNFSKIIDLCYNLSENLNRITKSSQLATANGCFASTGMQFANTAYINKLALVIINFIEILEDNRPKNTRSVRKKRNNFR